MLDVPSKNAEPNKRPLLQSCFQLCCIMTGSPSDESFEMRNSSVLAKLLEGQRVDTIGIVRAYEIYSGLPPEIQVQ